MKGKSQAMIDQIRRMQAEGHSIKKITLALKVSRNTVRRYLRTEEPSQSPEAQKPRLEESIDWEMVASEIKRGRPVKRIYEEIGPTLSYAHFSRLVRAKNPTPQAVAIRLCHEPGEKTQVDYATGISITEPGTGKTTPTQFFCGVLPFSSLTFGEFSLSQRTPDFIRSHERMWAYFGGVTKYVVLDNLKAGVKKAHRYDPDINPTYCDYSNHSGFVPLPARVRTPRDKAAVEATIGVIQRDFFDKYRNTKFYSLTELNQCFRKYLDEFNRRIMQDYGASRRERFESEKGLLKPLSESPYEFFEWKMAKVHPHSCIELQKSVYSVPYEYAHRTVQVKYSDKLVIILDETAGNVLATHVRQARFKHSIKSEHLPAAKTQLATFDVRKVKKFAELVGPNTTAYVEWQFESELDHPLRALRRLQGLVRFYETKNPDKQAMEYAAKQAAQFRRKDLKYFQNCATAFDGTGARMHLVKPPIREMANIHVRSIEGE